jgi:hypothetical protein
MSTEKTYLVTFCVQNCYRITLTAVSADAALDKGQNLYDDEHEAALEVDDRVGGSSDWNAQEVQP